MFTLYHTFILLIYIIHVLCVYAHVGIQRFHMKDSSLECTYTLLKANVVAQVVRLYRLYIHCIIHVIYLHFIIIVSMT